MVAPRKEIGVLLAMMALLLLTAVLLRKTVGISWLSVGSILGGLVLLYGCFINRWHGIALLMMLAPFYGYLRFVIGLSDRQIIIKELMVVLITVSTVVVIVVLKKKGKLVLYNHDRALLVFLFMLLIQFFRTPEPIAGLLGLRMIVTYIPLYAVVRLEESSRLQVKRTLCALLSVVVITTVYGLWQAAVGRGRLAELGLDKVGTSIGATGVSNLDALRIFATYPGPEYFGAMLVLAILMLTAFLMIYPNKTYQIAGIGIIILMSVALALTMVRIEWAMLVLGLLAMSILLHQYRLLAGVLIVLPIVLLLLPGSIMERAELTFSSSDESFTARKTVYAEWNIINIGENMAGTGLGTTNASSIYSRLGQRNLVSKLLGGGATESWYASLAIETGLFGVAIYLWLVFSILKYVRSVVAESVDPLLRSLAVGFFSFTVSILIVNVVAPTPLIFPACDLYYWVLLGIIVTMFDRERAVA